MYVQLKSPVNDRSSSLLYMWLYATATICITIAHTPRQIRFVSRAIVIAITDKDDLLLLFSFEHHHDSSMHSLILDVSLVIASRT